MQRTAPHGCPDAGSKDPAYNRRHSAFGIRHSTFGIDTQAVFFSGLLKMRATRDARYAATFERALRQPGSRAARDIGDV